MFRVAALVCLLAIYAKSALAEEIIIHSPALYEKLRTGGFRANANDEFVIKSSAHADILSQPAHFANSTHRTLYFQADDYSFVYIDPQKKVLHAYFYGGDRFTAGLPADYNEYYLGFAKDVVVGRDDVDHMFRWTRAKVLWLSGATIVAFKVQQRHDQLKRLRQLESLQIDVSARTADKLRPEVILGALPSLVNATFYRNAALTVHRFEAFANSQSAAVGWHCELHNRNEYVCTKN